MKKIIIVLLLAVMAPQIVVAQSPTIDELYAKVVELTRILENLKAQLAARTPASQNQVPVITRIDGPTSLAPGVSGTWEVMASDVEDTALTYSVFWGDMSQPTIQNTNSFTHSFAAAGNYYLTFVVSDRGGKSVRGNAAVLVSSRDVSAVTGNAEISVVDYASGEKLAGATITLLNISAQPVGTGVTRADTGLTFNNLPVGVYTAAAVAVGYKSGQTTFTVVRSQTAKPVVRLEKVPVLPLTVSVKSSSGEALRTASIMIYNENGLVATKLTNESGVATFTNLPAGRTYRAEVFRLGYVRPNPQTASVDGSASASLNFTLYPVR